MTYKPSDDWVEEERRHGHVRTYWVGCRCLPCTEANTRYASETEAARRASADAARPVRADEWDRIYRQLAVLDAVYSPRDSLALRAAVEWTRAELEGTR